MRVVGGTHRGRRIEVPSGSVVRPTSDRAREAVFNILYGLGLPEGAAVLDLFAGSGALGIEALSRGAAEATFVDSDHLACETITSNLHALGLGDNGRTIRAEALNWLSSATSRDGGADSGDSADLGNDAKQIKLVFADPPYEFTRWPELLSSLDADVVVCESDRELAESAAGVIENRWSVWRVRHYGRAVITILRHSDTSS